MYSISIMRHIVPDQEIMGIKKKADLKKKKINRRKGIEQGQKRSYEIIKIINKIFISIIIR